MTPKSSRFCNSTLSFARHLEHSKREIPNSEFIDSFHYPFARVDVNLNFIKLQVVRLSAATQDVPRSIICNVHGVNPRFLEVGKAKNAQQQRGEQAFAKGAYYIGKWSGVKATVSYFSYSQSTKRNYLVFKWSFRNGEYSDQVKKSAEKLRMKINVHPGCDHADPLFHE